MPFLPPLRKKLFHPMWKLIFPENVITCFKDLKEKKGGGSEGVVCVWVMGS